MLRKKRMRNGGEGFREGRVREEREREESERKEWVEGYLGFLYK
jgi:hypothetical protein